MIVRVVSGGQTGVDRAALDAAMVCGVPHGGWCPKGRRAEDGVIPGRYELIETEAPVYAERTRKNVEASDATLLFTRGEPGGGTRLTMEICRKRKQPHLLVDVTGRDDASIVEEVRVWLKSAYLFDDLVLNVAGPRESQCPGIHARVTGIMKRVLSSG